MWPILRKERNLYTINTLYSTIFLNEKKENPLSKLERKDDSIPIDPKITQLLI